MDKTAGDNDDVIDYETAHNLVDDKLNDLSESLRQVATKVKSTGRTIAEASLETLNDLADETEGALNIYCARLYALVRHPLPCDEEAVDTLRAYHGKYFTSEAFMEAMEKYAVFCHLAKHGATLDAVTTTHPSLAAHFTNHRPQQMAYPERWNYDALVIWVENEKKKLSRALDNILDTLSMEEPEKPLSDVEVSGVDCYIASARETITLLNDALELWQLGISETRQRSLAALERRQARRLKRQREEPSSEHSADYRIASEEDGREEAEHAVRPRKTARTEANGDAIRTPAENPTPS
jgi:uncharacterized protein YoxC